MEQSRARRELVKNLRRRGIWDENVLEAIRTVPRHLFVPAESTHLACLDEALPIGFKQTISQPYVVAMMTQALALAQGDRVLDVGTGSGYQVAILAGLCREVLTMEVVPELSGAARLRIRDLGIDNVRFVIGDGSQGLSDYARFDAIVVAAAAPEAPHPLLDQLAEGGRMVIPIGSRKEQRLTLIKRVDTDLIRTDLGSVRFVPLVGPNGFMDR